MKKNHLLVLIALSIAIAASPVLGQTREARGDREARPPGRLQGLSEEEAQKLREQWRSMSEEEKAQVRQRLAERAPAERDPLAQLQAQLDAAQAEHEKLIKQLQAIRDQAKKEKAGETGKLVDKLIAQQTEAYQARQRGLKQRMERLRAAAGQRQRDVRTPRDQDQGGRRAPAFSLPTFDGKEISLRSLRGKTVVLEWFNFECPFSIYHYEKVPTMAELAKKYKDKDVVWLAVNSTNHTTPDKNRAFAKENKLAFPILDDRSGKVGKAFGAKTTPHVYVINSNGVIVYDGAIDNAPLGKVVGDKKINYVDEVLAALTANKDIPYKTTEPYGCSVKYPPQ